MSETTATQQSVTTMAVRHHVTTTGPADGPALLFVHGFGCDQEMWRPVAEHFAADHRVVLFDQIGAGRSDTSGYDPERYAGFAGYAADLLGICEKLDLRDVTVVAHCPHLSAPAETAALVRRHLPTAT